ncbi:MAG: iron-sulfur cluster assembly scaffold protein [archaeon]
MVVSNYSKKVIENFMNPKNMGSMENPDAVGKAGNPVCGDQMNLYLKIEKNKEGKEIIKDIKFKTLGCGAAIATSSMITEIAKGKTIDEAMKITKGEVADSLDGLPPIKMHCSNLAADALRNALKNYLAKKPQ